MEKRYALGAHRFQVRAACDHRHVVPGGGELCGHMAADGAGAKYTDSHPATQILMTSL
jgi:hypothetical protein